MPPELSLVFAPGPTYAALVRSPGALDGIGVRAFRRPLLVLVVIGVSMALSSTRHVTPALVLSTTALWSVVVIAQSAVAWAVIPRTDRTGAARAFDLYFASHTPWSLWILFYAAWAPSPLGRPAISLWIAAIPPVFLTPWIIAAFFREVCGMDRRRAVSRTLVQQAISWGLFLAFAGAAVAIWPRVLQALR